MSDDALAPHRVLKAENERLRAELALANRAEMVRGDEASALDCQLKEAWAEASHLRALLATGADLVTETSEPSTRRADWLEAVRRALVPMR